MLKRQWTTVSEYKAERSFTFTGLLNKVLSTEVMLNAKSESYKQVS